MRALAGLRRIKSASAYALLFGCGVIWGMTFALARIASDGGGHPIGLAFWQAFGGAVLLFGFCAVRGRAPRIGGAWRHSVVIAVCGTAVPGVLYFYAAPHVPSGVLAIVSALVPMMTYGLSWLCKMDWFDWRRLCGIVSGLCAVLLLVAPDAGLPERSVVLWLAPALIATMFYTVENVYVDARVAHDADMPGLLAVALLMAAAALTPLMIIERAFYPITVPLDASEKALLAMMAVSSVAYVMFLRVVQIAGAVFAGMSGYIITMSGVFWGMWWFDERHSWWVWGALALMLLGMFLVTPRERAAEGRG